MWSPKFQGDFTAPRSKERVFLRKLTEHLAFRVAILLLIVVDIVVEIVAVVQAIQYKSTSDSLNIVGFVLSTVFFVECNMRLIGLTARVFCSNWVNWFDYGIVTLALISNIVAIAVKHMISDYAGMIIVFRALRFPVLLMPVRAAFIERHRMVKATRQQISENKQRLQKDGFDLDMCYIKPNIIAMSYPSSGLMALYRNPIGEVARFLDLNHKDKYKVYNLCSEMNYSPDWFQHNVARVMIDDHNVPTVKELVRFAYDAARWLDVEQPNGNKRLVSMEIDESTLSQEEFDRRFVEYNDKVLVVHCKGGKGRTGTCICTALLYLGYCDTAAQALEYFGMHRTDLSIGTKFQGVETPSQSRYVGYFEQCMKEYKMQVPERSIKLTSIILTGFDTVGNGDLSDFSMQILQSEDKDNYDMPIGVHRPARALCSIDFTRTENFELIQHKVNPTTGLYDLLINFNAFQNGNYVIQNDGLPLKGDIKVMFFPKKKSHKQKVPVAYEKCAFYFWFNTAFINQNKLDLTRDQLDNPHKSNKWHVYTSDFCVSLNFKAASN